MSAASRQTQGSTRARNSGRYQPAPLETVSVEVPETALEPYEAALLTACFAVGYFRDSLSGRWTIEGIRSVGRGEQHLVAALALAEDITGIKVRVSRKPTPAEGWLAASRTSFPEQLIGRRFAVRGTHISEPPVTGRITLILDAGLAFGSGEHGSTRGCLRAIERVAKRRPRRILDIGTGSGILAMAVARLLRRRVIATDIEPASVSVAKENAAENGLRRLIRVRLANGWLDRSVRAAGPFDLVVANILARPLCMMARQLSTNLAPGGTAILSGLLTSQIRSVVAAHLRCGLHLETVILEQSWATLILRRKGESRSHGLGR
jgi:ribosomal protein L11 methyltransferase